MTNVEGRTVQLELAVKALQAQLAAVLTRLAAAEQLGRSSQGITYNWGGGGGATASYWAMAPAGGIGPSTGTFPAIAPVTVALAVFQSIGGGLTALGTRNCNWYYRDSCPQFTLLPLQASSDGTSFDIIANSCTAVNP